jgi:Xaa-Pro aminopeptidase
VKGGLELRVSRLRQRLESEGLAALVVFNDANCRYLTGFTGEAASVCVTSEEVILVTDSRFTLQAQEQAPHARLLICEGAQDEQLPQLLQEVVSGEGTAHVVGVDLASLTVKRWEQLHPLLESAGLEWRLVSELVETCRQVKFPDELEALRKSGALVSQAFRYIESVAVVGRTEHDVTLDVEMHLRRLGAEGVAFPFIVAAGARGAMPHAEPGHHVIGEGQLVIFDIGTVVDGYASDITRTYSTGGRLEDELVTAYNAVLRAQEAAVAAARAGVSCRELDSVARDVLVSEGLGEFFVHSLGHGVGLEVHEAPTLSQRSEGILQEGMVVTIEPGVYFAGRGGIRIEDTVIIHSEGAEIITPWPKELRYLL